MNALAGGGGVALTVVLAGAGSREGAGALEASFPSVEYLFADDAATAEQRLRSINLAVDSAAGDWILLLRPGETVTPALAQEIALHIVERRTSWACRIRVRHLYAGRPLPLERDREGEVRLYHRRHARFRWREREEIVLQGPVLRLTSPLVAILYESVDDHRASLAAGGMPRSCARRVGVFLALVKLHPAAILSASASVFLWNEAAFDFGGRKGLLDIPPR
jgi:hypothetical protein